MRFPLLAPLCDCRRIIDKVAAPGITIPCHGRLGSQQPRASQEGGSALLLDADAEFLCGSLAFYPKASDRDPETT